MAKEVLELNVKSDIGKVAQETDKLGQAVKQTTTDFKDLNEQIDFQNKILNDLEKELIDLKAQQDAIPKGAFYANADKLNKQIADTTKEIKLEKIGLKDLKQQQATATRESKKFTDAQKEQDKVLKDGIGNFRIMGVSLNDVRSTFGKIIPTAKAMFGTIKAGIASTGIGLLILALGSLATYFTSTKKGADQLKVAFAAVGATIDVIKDRISTIGGAVVKFFKGDLKGAINDVKDATKGVIEEIKEEVKVMTQLEKSSQKLRDAEIEFSIAKAKTRQEIEKARLIAEDETKSAKERLDNLKRALDLETQTTQKELQLARERMKVQEEEMALSENSAEDEAELARLRAQVIEVETASFRMRRRVITEVNSLENEIRAEAKARADEKKAEEEAELARLTAIEEKETERRNKLLESANQLIDEYYTKILDAETQEKNAITDKYFSILNSQEITSEQRVDLERAMQSEMTAISDKFAKQRADNEIRETQRTEAFKRQTVEMGFGALSALAGEDEKAQKAIAVAKTIFNTQQAIMNAMANVPAPFNTIQAIAAGVMGAKSIQTILSTSSSGGGGGNSNVSAVPSAAGQAPSQQMVSGQFSLDNMTEPQPLQAYVVSDDITNNQEKLAAIRRRATI